MFWFCLLCYSVPYAFLYINIYFYQNNSPFLHAGFQFVCSLHHVFLVHTLSDFFTCILLSSWPSLQHSLLCNVTVSCDFDTCSTCAILKSLFILQVVQQAEPNKLLHYQRCFKHQNQKYVWFNESPCTKSLWKHLSWLFNIFLYFKIRRPQKLMQAYLGADFISSILWPVRFIGLFSQLWFFLPWIRFRLSGSVFGFTEFRKGPVHLLFLYYKSREITFQEQF